ncbi:hypothetical protein BH09ACT1_BH09ACT1_24700 [soil metagenome]
MNGAALGVTRRWVFPIIRILIFLAIAGALVKIAFFSGTTAGSDPTVPSGQISEPLVPVTVGTITNDVKLDATINADAALPVKATLAGEVKSIAAHVGQVVDAKTPVLTIRSEDVTDDGTPVVKTVTVLAGSAGTLSSLPVITGQIVAVGDAVGQVAPATFNVTGTLKAEQQYRLLNNPTEATVAITSGPAPFTCTGLTITTALAGAGTDNGSDGGSATGDTGAVSGGTTIRCAVPPGVTVFAGLAAKLTVSGGVAKDVLVVPTTAVQGVTQAGTVFSKNKNGTIVKHPVTLGLTDGKNVQVLTGVAEGDSLLQFVPSASALSAATDASVVTK